MIILVGNLQTSVNKLQLRGRPLLS